MSATTRRDVLKAGGALFIACRFGMGAVHAQTGPAGALPRPLAGAPSVDAWLRIGTDDRITVLTGKVEFGQGLKTALVQFAAEELDMSPSAIDVVTADTALTPNEAYTAGSRSIQDSGLSVRAAAAEARRILLEWGAEHFGVPPQSLLIVNGRVSNEAGDAVRFGELVAGRALERRIDGTAALKPRDAYRYVGRSLPRVDLPAKVFGGEPAFLHDLRLDGMLHARTVHPPTQASRLLEADVAAVRELPGVRHVLKDGSLLGVIAAREEQAIAAAARLAENARWTAGADQVPTDDTLEGFMRAANARRSSLAARGEPVNAARRITATYLRPFQAHASIGPSCAVAVVRNGQLTVWSHTQGIFPLREEMARVLGMPVDALHVISLEGAGCYGQNGADDAAIEAAMFALALPETPIRLQWSREDEFGWEPLGAAMLIDCDAALDDRGRIVDWRSTLRGYSNTARPNFGGGNGANLLAAQLREDAMPTRQLTNLGLSRNAVPQYSIPNVNVVEDFLPEPPARVSSLRSLGAYANIFAIESFIDELAAAAGADPVAFRLEHLPDPRGRAVLEAAAEAAGWSRRASLPASRGLGVAYARYSDTSSYCAVAAEVSLAADGAVRLHRLWAAADCGPLVNPDGVRNQIAGGAVQAASWTLKESKRLGVAGGNWSDYPILRSDEAPDVEVVLLERPDEPLLGAGEASQGPAGAAVANAVAAAGARVRQIPLTPARVLAAKEEPGSA